MLKSSLCLVGSLLSVLINASVIYAQPSTIPPNVPGIVVDIDEYVNESSTAGVWFYFTDEVGVQATEFVTKACWRVDDETSGKEITAWQCATPPAVGDIIACKTDTAKKCWFQILTTSSNPFINRTATGYEQELHTITTYHEFPNVACTAGTCQGWGKATFPLRRMRHNDDTIP